LTDNNGLTNNQCDLSQRHLSIERTVHDVDPEGKELLRRVQQAGPLLRPTGVDVDQGGDPRAGLVNA
jgi:hypothetical protein